MPNSAGVHSFLCNTIVLIQHVQTSIAADSRHPTRIPISNTIAGESEVWQWKEGIADPDDIAGSPLPRSGASHRTGFQQLVAIRGTDALWMSSRNVRRRMLQDRRRRHS